MNVGVFCSERITLSKRWEIFFDSYHSIFINWVIHQIFIMYQLIGEGNGNPLQCSCLENPRDGEAWAAVYGVAQSRTRLK